jgi:dihydroneopterin aldolase
MSTRPARKKALRATAVGAGQRRVFLRDLVVKCQIGVHAHERGGVQRVRFNVELFMPDDGTPLDDDIRNVVSYEDVVAVIKRLVEGVHINLVETLAERIALALLRDNRVDSVRVRVEKLDVYPEAAGIGVEIERHRLI